MLVEEAVEIRVLSRQGKSIRTSCNCSTMVRHQDRLLALRAEPIDRRGRTVRFIRRVRFGRGQTETRTQQVAGLSPLIRSRSIKPVHKIRSGLTMESRNSAVTWPLVHTYSIVARDAETGQLGVAVESHYFSVGSVVTWAEAGVGAVATQSLAHWPSTNRSKPARSSSAFSRV
jgi:uncharacterized protein DUF1028